MFRRLMFLAAVCVFVMAPATAAGGATATTETVHSSDCSDMEFDLETGEIGVITTCFNSTFVFHGTARPDGGFTATTNTYFHYSYTVTVGGMVVDEGSSRSHSHQHYVSDTDTLQVAHELTRVSFEGAGVTCTENALFHVANDQVRVDRYEAACEPA